MFSNFDTKVSKINGTFLYKQGECHEKGFVSFEFICENLKEWRSISLNGGVNLLRLAV